MLLGVCLKTGEDFPKEEQRLPTEAWIGLRWLQGEQELLLLSLRGKSPTAEVCAPMISRELGEKQFH